jgi:hypothetical protein
VSGTRQVSPSVDLVPGELRGYRQFDLRSDGLHPLVHDEGGPWSGGLEQARCALGHDHPSPAADCRCGLYGWYLPGSATVAVGPASAVVAVRGRCILGDRGFRAASARIEAVALPLAVRVSPAAAGRARTMLAERYPEAVVYDSVRRMLKEHPPDDVRALGIDPRPDPSRRYRAAAMVLWLTLVVPTYALFVVPAEQASALVTRAWPLLVLAAVAWQAGIVWLFSRLLGLQGAAPPTAPRPQPH